MMLTLFYPIVTAASIQCHRDSLAWHLGCAIVPERTSSLTALR